MHILIVNNTRIPALEYGGTERVLWWLGKELVKKGHTVSYLVKDGSVCEFARVISYNPHKSLNAQIPGDVDLIHLNFLSAEIFEKPCLTTLHGNVPFGTQLPLNCVFVSKNHAARHGSEIFVHNGLDFSDYGDPGLENKREYYHFLGKAAWRVKNVSGAIRIINQCKEKMVVLGGNRINFKMGLRITPHLNIRFKGIIGGEKKNEILRKSKGLLFPVLWHEPFGLAITESLYFGCPVFGTPYGSLPELVSKEVGYLSASEDELIDRVKHNTFSPKTCHDYAISNFGSELMAERYLKLYEKVLNGENLNHVAPQLQTQQKEKFLPFNT